MAILTTGERSLLRRWRVGDGVVDKVEKSWARLKRVKKAGQICPKE